MLRGAPDTQALMAIVSSVIAPGWVRSPLARMQPAGHGAMLFTGQIVGTLATIASIAAISLMMTGLLGWCPAYLPLGLSTCKNNR